MESPGISRVQETSTDWLTSFRVQAYGRGGEGRGGEGRGEYTDTNIYLPTQCHCTASYPTLGQRYKMTHASNEGKALCGGRHTKSFLHNYLVEGEFNLGCYLHKISLLKLEVMDFWTTALIGRASAVRTNYRNWAGPLIDTTDQTLYL